MFFSEALEFLANGERVARTGWNGKGMWIQRMDSGVGRIADEEVELDPFIVMKTAQDHFIPWLASQADLLAEDWEVVAVAKEK